MNETDAINLLVKRETNLVFAFPIKLYRINVKEVSEELFHNIQYSIEKFLENTKVEKFEQWPEKIKTTFSYTRTRNHILGQEHFKKLTQFIITESKKYYVEFKRESNLKLFSSWINLYEKNDFQFRHSHIGDDNNSIISGIYYHKTYDEGGELVFYNPLTSTNRNNIIFDEYKIKPKNGDLIFFPSFLGHRVNPNLSDNVRKSISFNLKDDYKN